MSIAIKQAKFQGDPGLFGFLGRAAKSVARTAVSTFVPGPIRTVASAALGAVAGRATSPSFVSPSVGTFVQPPARRGILGAFGATSRPGVGRAGPSPVTRTPGIRGAVQRFLPGGATGFEVGAAATAAGMAPKGFHLNKTGYFLSSAEEFGTFVAPMTRFVRNRRRNPGNMRAADRAISRIESAKRMAKRLSRITVRSRRCPK